MARKSRKTEQVLGTAVYIRTALYAPTAAYIRLSVEDISHRGNSIESQQRIIEDYIEHNPDLKLYDTYIDNGATGTTFERKDFKRMLEDIEAGKIKCIVVKDLSRLGRNSIDTGYYIEKYFPSKQVRFISINDSFDTDTDTGGIILPLKNLLSEAYSIDISRKIRAQAQQSMKAGDYIGARPPYGYIKSPTNCHKLIIDIETAPVIKQIFEWAHDGVGLNDIVKRLNTANILTPSHHKQNTGLITHENLIGKSKWQTRTVGKFLADEVYTGDMVQGKTTSINHKQTPVSKENWIVMQNTHESIITRELFEAVQAIREQVANKCIKRDKKPYTENILKGKIFCECCGGSLHRQRNERKLGPDVYCYHCISNSRAGKGSCVGALIYEKELFPIILETILKQVEIITGKANLIQKSSVAFKDNLPVTKAEISKLNQEINKCKRFLKSLYENLINNVITSEEYFDMKAGYEAAISSALNKISALENEQDAVVAEFSEYHKLAESVKGIGKETGITTSIVENLIERIEVSKDKKVEITFLFENEFDGTGEVCHE